MSDGEATGGEGSDGGRKVKKLKLTVNKGQSPTGSRAGSPAPGKAGSVGGSRAGSPAAPQSMQSISYLFGGSGFMIWKESAVVPWCAIFERDQPITAPVRRKKPTHDL